jgi:hypothetical protein
LWRHHRPFCGAPAAEEANTSYTTVSSVYGKQRHGPNVWGQQCYSTGVLELVY